MWKLNSQNEAQNRLKKEPKLLFTAVQYRVESVLQEGHSVSGCGFWLNFLYLDDVVSSFYHDGLHGP